MNKENPHDGCCNRHHCNHDLNNCCYLTRRNRDMVNFIDLKK